MPRPADTPEAHRIADALRARILGGTLSAGTRLVQETLAEEFSVSRIPIRTALSMLAQEGLVQQSAHRGTFVRAVSARDLADLGEVVEAVDLLSARLATRRRTDEDLAAMRHHVEAIRVAMQDGDVPAAGRAAFQMRKLVLAAAHNESLTQATATFEPRLRHLFAVGSDPLPLVDFSSRLYSAIAERDTAEATAVLGEHMTRIRRRQRTLILGAFADRDGARPDAGAFLAGRGTAEAPEGIPEISCITSALRLQILRGARSPGSRISERAIGEEFGIGRIPAQAVISSLVSQGLVSPGGPRAAARVREITRTDILDALSVSETLSALAVRLSSQRVGSEDLTVLHRQQQEAEGLLAGGDTHDAGAAVEDLHELLLRLADNTVLSVADEAIRWRLHRPDIVSMDPMFAARVARDVYRAIAFRDAELAAQASGAAYAHVRERVIGSAAEPPYDAE